jgi:protein-disulfide isomerase
MNKNNIIITVVSVLAMVGFIFGAYSLTNKPAAAEFPQLKEVKSNDNFKWSSKKQNVLIEYSDLQCPACQAYGQLFKQLESDADFPKIKENITFVYRHFPLDNAHKNARAAAYAAEAASTQGKFFEMHDKLFAEQREWEFSDTAQKLFEGYAKELKLDITKFNADVKSKAVQDKVQSQFLSGTEVNVQGTPTFFLNGKKLENPGSVEEMKKVLLGVIK